MQRNYSDNFLGHVINTPESMEKFALVRRNLRLKGICVRLRGRMTHRRAKAEQFGYNLPWGGDIGPRSPIAQHCYAWAIYIVPKKTR